jgi:hypothetical protein
MKIICCAKVAQGITSNSIDTPVLIPQKNNFAEFTIMYSTLKALKIKGLRVVYTRSIHPFYNSGCLSVCGGHSRTYPQGHGRLREGAGVGVKSPEPLKSLLYQPFQRSPYHQPTPNLQFVFLTRILFFLRHKFTISCRYVVEKQIRTSFNKLKILLVL